VIAGCDLLEKPTVTDAICYLSVGEHVVAIFLPAGNLPTPEARWECVDLAIFPPRLNNRLIRVGGVKERVAFQANFLEMRNYASPAFGATH
jgi:hypothetical protein